MIVSLTLTRIIMEYCKDVYLGTTTWYPRRKYAYPLRQTDYPCEA